MKPYESEKSEQSIKTGPGLVNADDLKRLGQQVLIDQKDVIQKTFVMLVFTMAVYELVNSLAVMIDGIILAHSFGEYAIAAHALMTPV